MHRGLTFDHVKSVKIQGKDVAIKNIAFSKDSLLDKIDPLSVVASQWENVQGSGSGSFDAPDQSESTTKLISRRNFTYNDLQQATGYKDKVWTSDNPDIFTIDTTSP